MINDVVSFMGKDYVIPASLKVYVVNLKSFENIYDEQLMPLLTQQMENRKWVSGSDEDFAYFREPLENVGMQLIQKLAEMEIYDVTVDDLVYNNQGYIQLLNTCKKALNDMKKIISDSFEDWVRESENARINAASKVTGSGTRIYTSSFATAAIFSLMESSVVSKQADKATKEYQDAIAHLNTVTNNKQEQQELNYLVNKYYPSVAKSLEKFVSDLLIKYLHILDRNEMYSEAEIKGYDFKRSCDLLKNISLVGDKKAVLEKAFLCCPYNPDVYQAIIDCDMIDKETFETAQFYLQDTVLLDSIKKYCIENQDDYSKIEIPVQIWISFTDDNRNDIIREVYNDKINSLLAIHDVVEKITNNENEMTSWIKRHFEYNSYVLFNYSDDKFTDGVEKYIRFYITEDLYQFLVKENMLNMIDLIPNIKANTLDNIKTEYTQLILKSIKSHFSSRYALIDRYKREADITIEKYNKEMNSFNNKIKKMQDDLSELERDKNKAGILAFGKKKDLTNKIEAKANTIKEFREKNNPNVIIRTFNSYIKDTELCREFPDLIETLQIKIE